MLVVVWRSKRGFSGKRVISGKGKIVSKQRYAIDENATKSPSDCMNTSPRVLGISAGDLTPPERILRNSQRGTGSPCGICLSARGKSHTAHPPPRPKNSHFASQQEMVPWPETLPALFRDSHTDSRERPLPLYGHRDPAVSHDASPCRAIGRAMTAASHGIDEKCTTPAGRSQDHG